MINLSVLLTGDRAVQTKSNFCGCEMCLIFIQQDDPSQSDLGTLANVVTSLAHLNKAREASDSGNDLMGVETLSNGDSSMTDIQGDEQTASDITR